jgi:regulator of protease activity HflC (stomatin/prohibitin superfamily)
MKRKTLVAVLSISAIGCGYVSPDAGHEAVLVEKPWFFGHGGVDPTPVTTGSQIVASSTEAIMVNTQPIRFDEAFEDMMSKDNVPMSFHAVPRMQITNTVDLIRRFGIEWYKNNVQRQFQNFTRNAAKSYSMTDLAINQASVKDLESDVQKELSQYLLNQSIPVKCLEVTVGRVSPPTQVIDAIKGTAEQQQRIKTEAQKKLAEDARRAAEESRAIADKAYQEKMGLTSQQFVELEKIKMCASKSNCSVFLGSQAVPVVGK